MSGLSLADAFTLSFVPFGTPQFIAHHLAVDGEVEEGAVAHEYVPTAEAAEPGFRTERAVHLHIRAFDAGQRRSEVGIVRPADRRNAVAEVEEAIPDFAVQAAALQDFDELDEAEGDIGGEPALAVEQLAEMRVAGEGAGRAGLFKDGVVPEERVLVMLMLADVPVNRVATHHRARILLSGDEEVAVAPEDAGLAPGRLAIVGGGDVSHLEQVRDVDVLGRELCPDVEVVGLLPWQVDVRFT